MSGTAVARGGDGLLDAVVVLLATWTATYHLGLLAGLGSTTALAVEAVLLLVWVAARSRPARARLDAPVDAAPERRPSAALRGPAPVAAATVTVVAALVAASAMATEAPWLLVWAPWLVAGAAGAVYAWTRLGAHQASDRATPMTAGSTGTTGTTGTTGRGEALTALALTLGLAGLAALTLRPNPDDLYYVNLSQWVAAHGTFPLRDTLYSDLGYPAANFPPIASYDALTGAVAHLLGIRAGAVVYVVVPPTTTALAVLAQWRLLRAWAVPRVTLALLAGVAFLLVDGTSSYGPPGNLWLTRLWQGKVILLCLLVPLLLVHLLRYAERPGRRGAAWLLVCGAAATGLSTTAIFLVPILALAGVAPLLHRAPRAAAGGFLAAAAYPLGAGVVTLATGGRSADDFGIRRQYRFDPSWFGHAVFLDGWPAVVAVGAVLVGALLVPRPAARVTTAVAVLLTGVTFVPGFTRLTYDLVGLGPTLWRVTWACTVAALVGVAASWVAGRLGRPWPRAAAGVAALALLLLGHPIVAQDTNTSFAAPGHWQRGAGSRALVSWIEGVTRPGDVVLAPDEVSITLVVTTTEVKVVAPRDYYLDYLRDDPAFHPGQRLTLSHLVNDVAGWRAVDVLPALRVLDVRVACVHARDATAASMLRTARFTESHATSTYRCFTAPSW